MDSQLRVSIDIHNNGDAVLLVEGELDIASGPRFLRWVEELPRTAQKRTLVDLTRLRFCDAAGIRALLAVYRELSSRTANTVFVAPEKDSVRKMLRIAGVATHVPIHTSTDVAVLGFGGHPQVLRPLPQNGHTRHNGKSWPT